uniref:BAG domain-containing protein n=1 Tax=Parastrongyloides trichosuri TaxID=131310 RepID=A0A0N4ZXG5_PARTI
MSLRNESKDIIKEITNKIDEYECYAVKNTQDIFNYEKEYSILLQNALKSNEIDEASYREIKICLNRLLLTTTQISLERITLVEIREKVNKIIHQSNYKYGVNKKE